MTSEIILHMSNIAKNINSSPFPDPISGIYILQKPLLSNNLRTPPPMFTDWGGGPLFLHH